MFRKNRPDLDILNGPILSGMFRFAIPFAVSLIFTMCFNIADVIVVGKFAGAAALAAVGATSAPISVLVQSFSSLSLGVNVVVAHHLGSGQLRRAQNAIHTAVLFSLLLGLLLCVVGYLVCTPLLLAMNTPEDILPQTRKYLLIYFLGVPPMLMYQFSAAVLRSAGQTKKPLYYLTAAGIVNVCLNLVLVAVFHFDVAGVAIATAAAQYISCILTVRCLMRQQQPLKLQLRQLRIDPTELGQIALYGIPSMITSVVNSLSGTIIQSSINSFGSAAIAGNSAANSLNNIALSPMHAMTSAALTFTSQNCAAGKHGRVRSIFRYGLLSVVLLSAVFCTIPCVFARPCLGIFLDAADPAFDEVIRFGTLRLLWVTLPAVIPCAAGVASSMVRGLGNAWLPSLADITFNCIFRVVWIFTAFAHQPTLACLYSSFPISWVLLLGVQLVCYAIYFKKWSRLGCHT